MKSASAKSLNTQAHKTTTAFNQKKQPTKNPLKPQKSQKEKFTSSVQQEKAQDEGLLMTEILQYYRGRVEAFEKDRVAWYEKLEKIRVKQELVHKAEWELKKRQEEKLQLDQALQQCHAALYNEREKIVKMKESADMMKLKSKENRQLILKLLESNNTVEQHIFYQKDTAPEKIQQYSKKGGLPLQSYQEADVKVNVSNKQPNVLRTIYLGNDHAGHVKSEVESLHQQIQEQRVHYESVLEKLRDDRAQFEEDQRRHHIDQMEEVQTLMKKLQEQEGYNQQVVKDHVDLMAQYEVEERKVQEEVEAIRLENLGLRSQIREVTQKTEQQKKEAREEFEKNSTEFQGKFRSQTKMQKENIQIIKDQYKKVQEIYKRKMTDMQGRLHKETGKLQITENRRKLDLEGYEADLKQMKKKVNFYQKYIGKLRKLVEEDQPDLDSLQMDPEDDKNDP